MLILLILLYGSVDEAAKLSLNANYEESDKILSKIEKHERCPKYYFYRSVNAYSLNKKDEALDWINMVENSFEAVPQRYLDLALIMKYDISTWKDNLDDISREMKKASDRLRNGKGGPKTQEIQKDVENRLAKMIKDIEDARDAQAKAAMKEAEEKHAKKQQDQPPDDTPAGGERGSGRINPKKVKELAEVWGKLPEKERVKALRELQLTLPRRDRRIIEAYLEELQKRTGK